MKETKDVTTYLQKYGPALAGRIADRFKPLVTAPQLDVRRALKTLKRSPFPAQAGVVEGLVALFKSGRRHGFIVAECGTGKTIMSMAVPHVLSAGKPYRALVMAPGHLVEKWKREIEETIPDATVTVIGDWKAALEIANTEADTKPEKPRYYVISRDRAKLSYFRRAATVLKRGQHVCPNCFAPILDRDGVPVDEGWLKRAKRWCPACKGPLWQADGSRCRRVAPVEVIKKRLGKRSLGGAFFDFGIFDECHELKGQTAQGTTHGILMGCCRRTISMTGSIASGYADDLHFLAAKADIKSLHADGLEWGAIGPWMDRYGVRETVTRIKADDSDNVASRGRPSKHVRRKPGISPLVFSKYLMGRSVFLRLDDVADGLPAFDESVVQVPLGALEAPYRALEREVTSAVKAALAQGSKKLLGMMIASLTTWPDHPFDWTPLVQREPRKVIARPESLDARIVTPKEKRLVEIVKNELAKGRRSCIFVNNTGSHNVAERVSELLGSQDIEAVVLSAKIKPNDREAWLREQVADGAKVLVSQVKLVETGLDLLEFPTLVLHQIPLSTFTLRQASRRSWRIGQGEPVRVYYMAYEGTLQSKLLSLMASKISASSALEGSFSEDGLAALAGGEDLTTELARTLAEGINLQDAGRAWAKVSAGKPKPVVKPEVEPRVSHMDPFVAATKPATSPKRTVRKRARRAAHVVALPAFA